MTQNADIMQIAVTVAESLATAKRRGESAVISTPILAYGHTFVPVHINPHENGALVSDGGFAKREASLLGGDNVFGPQARRAAAHYGASFDGDIFYSVENASEIAALVSAVASVANASKAAIEGVMQRMAETHIDDNREVVFRTLRESFPHWQLMTGAKAKLSGAREQWEFDAIVQSPGNALAIDIVSPHAGSVTSSFAKFFDIRHLETDRRPIGVGVLLDKEKTPRLSLIADVASLMPIESVNERSWHRLAKAA
jgi:hypothetical protein